FPPSYISTTTSVSSLKREKRRWRGASLPNALKLYIPTSAGLFLYMSNKHGAVQKLEEKRTRSHIFVNFF
ncbi:MAG: hypothetical protein PHY23_08460, partial [Oscillospiraceae bacterium]|nr:hypothetical protein [Oscillospiraceae bacterium]